MTRTGSVLGLIVALVASLAIAAAAQSPIAAAKTQLTTAIYHAAELAQLGEAVAGAKLHVQHVVNCLQGPNGRNYIAAVGNVCQGQGNGILVDLAAASGAGVGAAVKEAKIAEALAIQVQGQTDVIQAQAWGREIAKHLREALKALGG